MIDHAPKGKESAVLFGLIRRRNTFCRGSGWIEDLIVKGIDGIVLPIVITDHPGGKKQQRDEEKTETISNRFEKFIPFINLIS